MKKAFALPFLLLATSSFALEIDQFSRDTSDSGEVAPNDTFYTPYVFDVVDYAAGHVVLNGHLFDIMTAGTYRIDYNLGWGATLDSAPYNVTVESRLSTTGENAALIYSSRSYQTVFGEPGGNIFGSHKGSVVMDLESDQSVALGATRKQGNLTETLEGALGNFIRFELLEAAEPPPPPAPPVAVLDGTGVTGRNIALNGTNGLTASSYSESGFYHIDRAVGAFDGFVYPSTRLSPGEGALVNRAFWIAPHMQPSNHWVQVDFAQLVNVDGFRVVVCPTYLGRGPKDVTVQISDDGENFTDHESFTLSMLSDQTVNLSSVATTRVFRLYVHNNQGDGAFIELDELEVYQPQ